MISFRANCSIWVCAVLYGAAFGLRGQSVPDYCVRVSATVQTNPARITLSWPPDTLATNYVLYRKTRDATSWGTATALASNATSYLDSSAAVGSAYEYRVSKSGWTGTTNYGGDGYIYAGIQVPLVDSRGKVVLIVDNTFTSSLAMELTRLQQDLVGDGWTVLRHDVARMAVDPANTSSSVWTARASEIASLKTLITADYNADPVNVKALFLFGHVPVPYSGELNPDGHLQHYGAWPADVYYGDMYGDKHGAWTDSSVDTSTNSPGPSDTRNWNVPGDGKFDQSALTYLLSLEVGRVDLANLPAFPLSEGELLRQYLDKDHDFRHGFVTAERRGLIDDNFGVFNGEAFAVCGWRNFAPFFGATNAVASPDWFPTLTTQSYLWGYGCGGGTFTSASGVGSTSDFAANDPQVVFTMMFGSWFGDWDSQDNFLRAPLATPSYTLTCAWAGRPYWEFHHMALGETIGFSTRVSQNNYNLYSANIGLAWVHIALMGDPTLRMHPVMPPVALAVATNGSGGVVLRWNPSPDMIAGYHVYRAATTAGPFTRLTSTLLTATNYTDPLVSSNVYMVRAIKLEASASGSYFNPSQGVFQSLDPSVATPAITLTQPTNNSFLITPINIRIYASLFDPAAQVTNVTFYTNGQVLATASSAPFTVTWTNPPLSVYTLTATADDATGFTTNSAPVTVTIDNGGRPQLSIAWTSDGSNVIAGQDILGRIYRVQFLDALSSTNWQTLGTATSSPSGTFQFTDPAPPASPRFYRTVYP